MDTLNIATWNILYDNQGLYGTSAQSDRQGSIVQTLDDLDMQLDAVGLLEVEDNQQSGHHGRNISRELTGGDGYWVTNKNAAEDLGLFGKKSMTFQLLTLQADAPW